MVKYMVKSTVYDTRTLSGLTTVGFIYETYMGYPDNNMAFGGYSTEKGDVYFDAFDTEQARKSYLDQMVKDARAEKCPISIKKLKGDDDNGS